MYLMPARQTRKTISYRKLLSITAHLFCRHVFMRSIRNFNKRLEMQTNYISGCILDKWKFKHLQYLMNDWRRLKCESNKTETFSCAIVYMFRWMIDREDEEELFLYFAEWWKKTTKRKIAGETFSIEKRWETWMRNNWENFYLALN